jgi:MFS family permease
VIPAFQRRNFICFTVDAAMFFFAISFVDMTSVMPSLLEHLTHQPVLIGVLGSVQTGSWLLPQFLAARIVAAQHRKQPIVIAATTISRLSWGLLILALIFYQQIGATVALVACYLSVGLFMFFDGVASLAWYDLIARAIAPTVRGRLFGSMSLSGGLFAVFGGLVVQRVVGNLALPFPTDYRLLAIVALTILTIGIIPLLLIVEPEGEVPPPPEPLSTYLRRLPSLVRNQPGFRHLVGVQLLVGASALAVPFYAPFAILSLKLPESTVGGFVVGVTLGAMVGGAAWGYLGDRRRKELAIRALATCGFLAPLVPLGLRLSTGALPAPVAGAAVAIAFFFVGCSIRAGWVAYANYVIEIADESERPVLIGLMNTLSGLLAVAPPIGGLLADWLGFEAAFAAAALCAGAGLALSAWLRVAESARIPLGQAEHVS